MVTVSLSPTYDVAVGINLLQLFQNTVGWYGLPLRVRVDFGTKKVKIASYVLECLAKGINRGSFITGRSVHNGFSVKLVAAWYGITRISSISWKQFLSHPLNEMHLFALHHVCLPRVNKVLAEFTQDWNFHPLESVNNQSLQQLYYSGITLFSIVNPTSPEIFNLSNWDDYGINDDSFFPKIETPNNLVVLNLKISQFQNHWWYLQEQVDPCYFDLIKGMSVYRQIIVFLLDVRRKLLYLTQRPIFLFLKWETKSKSNKEWKFYILLCVCVFWQYCFLIYLLSSSNTFRHSFRFLIKI